MNAKDAKTLVAEDLRGLRAAWQYAGGRLKPYAVMDFVSNGQQAVEAVEQAIRNCCPYDLVVLDIDMPEKDGKQALAEIRQIQPGIKAIFHTGSVTNFGFSPTASAKALALEYNVPVLVKGNLAFSDLVRIIDLTLDDNFQDVPPYVILPGDP